MKRLIRKIGVGERTFDTAVFVCKVCNAQTVSIADSKHAAHPTQPRCDGIPMSRVDGQISIPAIKLAPSLVTKYDKHKRKWMVVNKVHGQVGAHDKLLKSRSPKLAAPSYEYTIRAGDEDFEEK